MGSNHSAALRYLSFPYHPASPLLQAVPPRPHSASAAEQHSPRMSAPHMGVDRGAVSRPIDRAERFLREFLNCLIARRAPCKVKSARIALARRSSAPT